MEKHLQESQKMARIFLMGNIFIGLLIFGIVMTQAYRNHDQIVEETKNHVNNLSLVAEEALQASFHSIEIVMDQFAVDVKKLGSPYKMRAQDFETYARRLSKITSHHLAWADAKGDMQMYSNMTPEEARKQKVNVIDRDYFQKLMSSPSDQALLTMPYFGKVRKKWVVIMARRLQNQAGQFLGVVWCSIDQDFFIELKQKLNVQGNDVFVAATGTNPKYIYRYPEKSEIIGKDFTAAPEVVPVIERKLHRGVFSVTSPQDGRKRISSFSWVGHYPVFTVVGKDRETALIAWRSQYYTSLILTLMGIVSIAVLSLLYLRSHKNFRMYQAQLTNSAKFVAVGEMSGAIAHEINNPLMIISGHTSKINRLLSIDPPDRLEIQKSVEKIDSTVSRISNIILGLRKVSHQSVTDFAETSVDSIVSEVLSLSSERYRSAGVDLKTKLDSLNAKIKVNETQILQVLINLLNNSFDQVHEAPAPWVEISSSVKNKRVTLRVTDSGPGIPPEIAKEMMSPFFTTKKLGQGTGLGLSITKDIVEAHGGKFWYEASSPNTQFVIELPLA